MSPRHGHQPLRHGLPRPGEHRAARFDPDLVAQMEGIGYEMKDVGEYNMAVGGIAAIYLDRDNGIFYAGADPRRGYKALAY